MVDKRYLIAIAGVMAMAVLLFGFNPKSEKKTLPITADEEPFVLVELFTSEGCSSCPPADKLLGKIVEEARDNKLRIFALAFHVDYWNDLGWKDQFSRTEYSQRQRNYARVLGSNVYTPQMIINGEDQFVGSNSSHAFNSIENSLNKPAEVSVAFKNITMPSDRKIEIDYMLGRQLPNAVLHVAVVERGIIREIKNGENTGRTLHHENVVRGFKTIDLTPTTGTVTVSFAGDVKTGKASVIVYVQNPETKHILGARGRDLQ